VPFVVTIVATFLFASYMLLDPSKWLAQFMQLTEMTIDFRIFILILGIGYFGLAWSAEKYVLPRVAKVLGPYHSKFQEKTQAKEGLQTGSGENEIVGKVEGPVCI